jgi:hypothetical protein
VLVATALPPVTLRDLYMSAADAYWDVDVSNAVLAREAEEREQLMPEESDYA